MSDQAVDKPVHPTVARTEQLTAEKARASRVVQSCWPLMGLGCLVVGALLKGRLSTKHDPSFGLACGVALLVIVIGLYEVITNQIQAIMATRDLEKMLYEAKLAEHEVKTP